MKRLIVTPVGWPCALGECPPGLFVCDGQLCFKPEYRTTIGRTDAYNSAGEYFVADLETVVQPCEAEWEEYDE